LISNLLDQRFLRIAISNGVAKRNVEVTKI